MFHIPFDYVIYPFYFGDIFLSATEVADSTSFEGDGGLSYEWIQTSGVLVGGGFYTGETLDLDADIGLFIESLFILPIALIIFYFITIN